MKTLGEGWQYLTPEDKDLLAWWSAKHKVIALLPFAPISAWDGMGSYGFGGYNLSALRKKLDAMKRDDHYSLDKICEGQHENQKIRA